MPSFDDKMRMLWWERGREENSRSIQDGCQQSRSLQSIRMLDGLTGTQVISLLALGLVAALIVMLVIIYFIVR